MESRALKRTIGVLTLALLTWASVSAAQVPTRPAVRSDLAGTPTTTHWPFNGDFLLWNLGTEFEWPVDVNHWSGGSTADGWAGGPGYGGYAVAYRITLNELARSWTGSRYMHRIYWWVPFTMAEDGSPDGWSTVLEGSENGIAGFKSTEGVALFAGKRVTVGWWATTGSPSIPSGGLPCRAVMWRSFGTGDSYGTPTPFEGVWTATERRLTGAWQYFEDTFDIPSLDGTEVGSDGTDYVGWGLQLRAGMPAPLILDVTGVRLIAVE